MRAKHILYQLSYIPKNLPKGGLEPPTIKGPEPKPGVSTNFTTLVVLGGSRTPNRLSRNQKLYPIELQAHTNPEPLKLKEKIYYIR